MYVYVENITVFYCDQIYLLLSYSVYNTVDSGRVAIQLREFCGINSARNFAPFM